MLLSTTTMAFRGDNIRRITWSDIYVRQTLFPDVGPEFYVPVRDVVWLVLWISLFTLFTLSNDRHWLLSQIRGRKTVQAVSTNMAHFAIASPNTVELARSHCIISAFFICLDLRIPNQILSRTIPFRVRRGLGTGSGTTVLCILGRMTSSQCPLIVSEPLMLCKQC